MRLVPLLPALLALGACGESGTRPPDLEETLERRFGGEQAREAGREAHPAPTENWLEEEAEERNHAARAEWVRRMHRAPPGVDWEEVERRNGLALVDRHREATLAPPATASPWVERGSSNQAGRTHVARFSSDRTRLYVGSAFGGLWRGDPDGTEWAPLGDDTYGGVHFLAVVPPADGADPDVLVTATDGGIVLRSTDGGVTWSEPTGLGNAWGCRRLLHSTDGTDTLFLLLTARDGVRLYRSTDRGASWSVVRDLDRYDGDAWTPRDGDGTLWLLNDAVVEVSADHGDGWTEIGTIPDASGAGDLAGSEAGAPTLYAVLDGQALWRSDDAGESWASMGNLADYWGGSLEASTVDPQLFVYGGVELHKSFDSGDRFTLQNGWGDYYGDPAHLLHADIDGIDVLPDGLGGETWFVDTDGGTYRSVDGLDSTDNLSLSGLRVGQYYDVLTSAADPTHVAIGAQDQGYQLTNDVVQDDTLYEADQALSGDYGQLTSGDGTHGYVFSVYPGFILVQIGETSPALTYLDFPTNETYVPWLPPVVADPDDPTTVYFPATKIHRYVKGRRDTWTNELHSEQDFSVDRDEYVSRLAFSPLDHTRAWAATSEGRLWYSSDKGVTWTRSDALVPDDNWYYGQTIAPSLRDPDVLTVGGSGYGVPSVYRSEDGGRTFVEWDQGLPDTLVYTLVEAADGSGTLFAGTQNAAYRRDPGAAEWREITAPDAPITTYWDSEALTSENTIRFATYGRGVWDYHVGETEGGCLPLVDADGDGSRCNLDCDDAVATVSPDAPETCGDGIDQDCDGADLPCDTDTDTDPTDTDTTPETDFDPKPERPSPDGCGCATAWQPPPAILFLPLLLVRRRRHRVLDPARLPHDPG